MITYGKDRKPNGTVVPLWHVDTGPVISQVYLTTVYPWKMKGPHLHKVRRGLFFCVRGGVIAVTRIDRKYITHNLTLGDPPLIVPPGIPLAFYNPNEVEALLLNMPDPPWRENEKDEWPVEDWYWSI